MNPAQRAQSSQQLSPLAVQIRKQIPLYRQAIYFSLITSLLVLAPTLFMLEVYDRVVNSRSTTTLIMLIICVIGIYVVMEALEVVRSKLMRQAGERVDAALRSRLFDMAFEANLRNIPGGTTQPFNDLRTVRDFIASPAITAMMDAPASLIFLILVFIISPWLGMLALFGAVVQVMIGVRTEKKTLPVLTEANKAAIDAQNYAGGVLRNAQVISAMGMTANIHQRWMKRQRKFLSLQAQASDTAGANAAASKFIQIMQTSVILGASCWLTVKGMLMGGGGMMIVASTLGGRVLAPLAQVIAQWRTVVNARDAYQRLDSFLSAFPERAKTMTLPAPSGQLNVEGIVAGAPGNPVPILRGVTFAAAPGETIALIGPSAAGKTTLARLLMGIWPAASGKVRLDGADGTIAENIARFGEVDLDKVREAAELVGLTAVIDALPEGYQSRIGEDGAFLSGGQRQRVGLARAIYGDPTFVLLDEPNSSLDEAGEQALLSMLLALKQRRCTTIIITHRTSVLPAADKILLLRDGQVAGFGPRDDILNALKQAQLQKTAQAIPPATAVQGAA
jgi:ATP-binding cassette subfamily C exporter for protease/lipase